MKQSVNTSAAMPSISASAKTSTTQQGFTLIELLISLTLGLIISAAALQVYISFIKTESIQASGSSIQNASVFGLQTLEKSVRLANLGNPVKAITDSSIRSGIVMKSSNLEKDSANPVNAAVANALFTNSTGDTVGSGNQWTGKTNTSVTSDQLTIQYTNITKAPLLACDGNNIAVNQHVIERYYVRPRVATEPNNLILACQSVVLNQFGDVVNGLDGAGVVYISGVENFKVQLGIKTSAGGLTYISPANYRSIPVSATTPKPNIVSLKIGLLVRGTIPVIDNTLPNSYELLGESMTLSTAAQQNNTIRRAYESNIILRNAR